MTNNLSIDTQQKLMKNSHTPKDTVFSVDAETDGLYGYAFAIGVIVQLPNTRFYFSGRCPDSVVKDDWVKDTVLPAIQDMEITHPSSDALEEAFWKFWMTHKSKIDVVIAHCGSPVESGLFRRCVERNQSSRCWDGPYPAIHDVATLLLQAGEDPSSVDSYIKKNGLAKPLGSPHNPLFDAESALIVWNHLRNGRQEINKSTIRISTFFKRILQGRDCICP